MYLRTLFSRNNSEVKEVIELPKFDKRAMRRQLDTDKVEISEEVIGQLREFISVIASYYNDNPFHVSDDAPRRI